MSHSKSTLERLRAQTAEYTKKLEEGKKQARLDGYPVEIPRMTQEVMDSQAEYIRELESEIGRQHGDGED